MFCSIVLWLLVRSGGGASSFGFCLGDLEKRVVIWGIGLTLIRIIRRGGTAPLRSEAVDVGANVVEFSGIICSNTPWIGFLVALIKFKIFCSFWLSGFRKLNFANNAAGSSKESEFFSQFYNFSEIFYSILSRVEKNWAVIDVIYGCNLCDFVTVWLKFKRCGSYSFIYLKSIKGLYFKRRKGFPLISGVFKDWAVLGLICKFNYVSLAVNLIDRLNKLIMIEYRCWNYVWTIWYFRSGSVTFCTLPLSKKWMLLIFQLLNYLNRCLINENEIFCFFIGVWLCYIWFSGIYPLSRFAFFFNT